jgi:thiol:disulfide interchange protein DsbD
VVIRVPLPTPTPGRTLELHADSQGCADVGVCYPPNTQVLQVALPATGAKPGPYVEAAPRKSWLK